MAELYCEFNKADCRDNRCTTRLCAVSKDCEEAFRRLLPFRLYFPKDTDAVEDRNWILAFLKERRAVMKLACRQSHVKYTLAVSRKYLNDERVIFEALRRVGRRIRSAGKL